MDLERDLVRKAKKGDIHAFEQLVEGYQKKIYNTTYRFSRNREDAFDMTQDILIKIYTSLSKFREGSSFSTWVYRIAVNHCIDTFRRRRQLDLPIDEELASLDSDAKNSGPRGPEEAILLVEIREEIQRALDMLPDEQKISIILRDIQGFSYIEISEILGCALGTVKSRINRGRRAVRDILKDGELFSQMGVNNR